MEPDVGVRGCDIARGEAEGYITSEDTNRGSHILYIYLDTMLYTIIIFHNDDIKPAS